ncbi:BadF/BadG/BcrA/BcrD ATPase family protein [Devosia algicola]|uniref:BadF/BadG/BcrA/BcrD ATPase family protein n=1 Tax=Devosia algicola TaxID=3026418 RepID=A0ABY7YPU7_9HYPH|nr:BadF/BadG/BcrA/BcrD ATPase family protein [Devosia algicola]WDR02910.1 BadF/BadG/BcrA/BcrD ATPase family protein [Devosia algicola]
MSGRFIGIDIGGTASRWAVVDQDGELIARGAAAGATGHIFNPIERARLTMTLQAIGQECGAHLPLDQASLGITGYGSGAQGEIAALVGSTLNIEPKRVAISDDMELAYRAAFAPGTGHLISAGTGSIGLHIARDNSVIRVGGRGLLIDDGGSGTWIALEALNQLYRRIDETGGPADAAILAEELFDAMGGADWDAVRTYIYGGDRGRIGALAPAVATAASRGDQVSLAILTDAGVEPGPPWPGSCRSNRINANRLCGWHCELASCPQTKPD